MSLPDVKPLDIICDGVPFVRVDLVGTSDNLDIVSDGVPWVGYQAPAAVGVVFSPIWYSSVQEAI